MKFIRFVFVFFIVVSIVGYGVYHFGTSIAANTLSKSITAELESTGQIENVKQSFLHDPQVAEVLKAAENADTSKLPFTTKEEAAKVIVKKVGLNELKNLHSQYENGMTTREVQEVMIELEETFTEEEILALKVVAYNELNK